MQAIIKSKYKDGFTFPVKGFAGLKGQFAGKSELISNWKNIAPCFTSATQSPYENHNDLVNSLSKKEVKLKSTFTQKNGVITRATKKPRKIAAKKPSAAKKPGDNPK